jgi:NAD-dependent dihydropyrimidine dehydrogenase PreA subunit
MAFEFDFEFPEDEGLPQEEFDKIDRVDKASDQVQRAIVRIDSDLCENSGVCAEICPEDVLEVGSNRSIVAKPEACTECWVCVENCTSGAIEIG